MLSFASSVRRANSKFVIGDAMKAKLKSVFSLDYRALAAFRILFGVLLFSDIVLRLNDLNALYTDRGFMMRTLFARNRLTSLRLTLHRINTGALFQALLFLLHAAVALLFTVGYYTRVMTCLLWLLLTSLQTYNPVVLNGGDDVLVVFLVWACFLPLGRVWSLDAALRNFQAFGTRRSSSDDGEPRRASVCSIASAGFMINLVGMYVCAGAFKSGPDWFEGSAVHYSLHLRGYATPLAVLLRSSTRFCVAANYVTMFLESFCPLVYFLPMYNSVFRSFAALAYIALHVGFWFTLRVGLFAPACIVCHIAMFPTSIWDGLEWWFASRARRRAKLIVDASDSGESGRHALAVTQTLAQFAFSSSTEIVRAERFDGESMSEISSAHRMAHFPGFSERMLQMISVGELRRRGAPIAMLQASGQGVHYPGERARWHMLATLIVAPQWLRKLVVAPLLARFCSSRLSRWLTKRVFVCASLDVDNEFDVDESKRRRRQPSAASEALSVLLNVLVLFVLFICVYSNVNSLGFVPDARLLIDSAQVIHIDQYWGMFAPQASHMSPHVTLIGVLEDGRETDLWDGGPVLNYFKPVERDTVPPLTSFQSARWRRVMSEICGAHETQVAYAKWVCRQWNWHGDGARNRQHRLRSFELQYINYESPRMKASDSGAPPKPVPQKPVHFECEKSKKKQAASVVSKT